MDTRLKLVVVYTSVCLALIMSPAASLSVLHLGELQCANYWTLWDDVCWVRVPDTFRHTAEVAERFCQSLNWQLFLFDNLALCFNTGLRQDDLELLFASDGQFQKRVMGNDGM